MTKLISPCAECLHHIYGLTKECDKCKECKPRKAYVKAIENDGLFTNDIDPREGHRLGLPSRGMGAYARG